MFDWIFTPEGWIALVSLVSLEIVLGIDNIIFISILCGRLPKSQQDRARVIGISLAMLSRLVLLASLFWIMKLTAPLFTVFAVEISGRDLILIIGGLFLLGKATFEIHHALEREHSPEGSLKNATFSMVLVQIAIVDIVFSLDSVITAVGMVDHVSIMVSAVLASVAVMLLAAKPISVFVERNPTIKMLALSFLMLIGVTLVAEGFDAHVPKGYIYFAMAFSLCVELLNLRARKKKQTNPVHLGHFIEDETTKRPL